jgi:hypothetical protein
MVIQRVALLDRRDKLDGWNYRCATMISRFRIFSRPLIGEAEASHVRYRFCALCSMHEPATGTERSYVCVDVP